MVQPHSGFKIEGPIEDAADAGAAGEALLSAGVGAPPVWGSPAPGVHGVDQHTDVTRELFIPASEGHIAAGVLTQNGYPVVEGAVDADEPVVYLLMKVPDDFVSFTKVEAVWLSGDGDMYWRIRANYAAASEGLNTNQDTPAWAVTTSGGVNVINVQEPANPLALANLAKGDYIGFCFWREGTHVSDTVATVWLFGLLFTYVAEQ